MGTSKSLSNVKGKSGVMPNWPALSNAVTRSCDGTTLTPERLSNITRHYVEAIGGSSTAGRGSSKVVGRSGINTAKRLGTFFSAFSGGGNNIRQALAETGLTDLTGKTVSDVIDHLIQYCSGETSTIDDRAAKEASRRLLEELVSNASSIEEIEVLLEQSFSFNTSEDLIIKYFGYYIYEHLSILLYEHLVSSKNEGDCQGLFRQIREFIVERLVDMQKRNPLHEIDWSSEEGDRVIKNVYQDVLTVFE
ncbi:MAG: hypothetical protein K9G46_02695 [Flavobacteriales bacterium]|nr:hypothetical protein [Flavobacteriales bacterium]